MKTLTELKNVIGYAQTDEHFLDYLTKMEEADIIRPSFQDIVQINGVYRVSDDLYRNVSFVFGIQLDEDLNVINPQDIPNE